MTNEFILYYQRPKAFRLYIGFQKLGEFDTCAEARQYAGETNQSGVFNILGDNYRDSWYVSRIEIKQKTAIFGTDIQ